MSKQILVAGFSAKLAASVVEAGGEQGFAVSVSPSLVKATATLAVQPHDALILGVSSKNCREALTWLKSFSPVNNMYVMWCCDENVDADIRSEASDLGVDQCIGNGDFTTGLQQFFDMVVADHATAATIGDGTQFGEMFGASVAMKKVFRLLRRVAPTDVAVLLIGESGTGKELAAAAVHSNSAVSDGPYVAVNCGAIPGELMESELFGHRKGSFTGAVRDHAGFFEQAKGGTLFLDEITEMSPDLQVKLLRVLETGSFRRVGDDKTQQSTARIIAATNRDPLKAIEQGELREDIYYRLAQFPVRLPALRSRGHDVVMLAERFLKSMNSSSGTNKSFSSAALDSILVRDWPGNARELKNAIQQAYIMASDEINVEHIPESFQPSNVQTGSFLQVGVGSSLEDAEKQLIFATLERFDGNRQKAAETLGVSVKTIYNKLRQYEDDGDGGLAGGEQL